MSSPLEQALRRLVADGTLSDDQALAVSREVGLVAPAAPHARDRGRPSWTTLVTEIGGYVGGAFVLAAALVLVGPSWTDFTAWQRTAILGVPGVILLAVALILLAQTPGGWPVHHRRDTGPRRRLAAALVVVGGALVAGAVTVAVDPSDDWKPALYFGTATLIGAAAYAALRQPLLHVATAFAAAFTAPVVAVQYVDGWPWENLASGLAVIAVAAVWLGLALTGALAEAGLGLTVAGVAAFVGGEVVATGDRFEWVGFAVIATVAVAGLAGYVRTRHVGVLAVGVVALATVVPQAVVHYTHGRLGAAGVLLVTGLSILGASLVGVRLRGRTDAATPPPAAPSAPDEPPVPVGPAGA